MPVPGKRDRAMILLEELGIPVRAEEDMPSGYEPVTRFVGLENQPGIVLSIWSTLRYAGAIGTVKDGKIQFWRKPFAPNYRAKFTAPGRVETGTRSKEPQCAILR
jgi:hypothetical protein